MYRHRTTRSGPIVASLSLLASLPALAVEEPRYSLLEQQGSFELREVAAHLVAEIFIDAGAGRAANEGFGPLVRYIGGANRRQEKISMTAPVTQAAAGVKIAMTAPVGQAAVDEGFLVSFVIPATYTLETVPLPTDTRIRIREVPAQTVAVLRYSGSWSANRYAQRERQLLADIHAQGIKVAGPPRWARYNSPFSLPPLRRNEVIVPVEWPERQSVALH